MSAILSDCGQYRFRLKRDIECNPGGPVVALFGINPSTADATTNDATIRKEIGFAQRNGWGRIIKGNVFPYRATDVNALKTHEMPIHIFWENYYNIGSIIHDADILIPCWGAIGKLPKNLRDEPGRLMQRLLDSGKPVYHFGKTSCGNPKHPLMLGYDTPITPWS